VVDLERKAWQDAADDPTSQINKVEAERLNLQIQNLLAGQAVRKFCIEQAVSCACNNPNVDPKDLTEAFYRFMTADLERLH
jgi:hypothetical protein